MTKQFRPVFLLLGIVLMSLASCQDKSTALVRSWKLQNLKYTKNIPESMKPTIQRSIDEMKKSFVISYSPDGSYVTQMKDKAMHGTWKLNFNSSKISVVSEGGKAIDYSIVELNPSTYTFKAIENGQEVIFEMVPAN
jgi:uncharacterized membrane protein YukC